MLVEVTRTNNLKILINIDTLQSIDERTNGETVICLTDSCSFDVLEKYEDICKTISSWEPIITISKSKEN